MSLKNKELNLNKYWNIAFCKDNKSNPIKYDYTYVKKEKGEKEVPEVLFYNDCYWLKYSGAYTTHTFENSISEVFFIYRKVDTSNVSEREIFVISD